MFMITEISEQDISTFWKQHLWDTIRLSSSIVYGTNPYEYDLNYHEGPRTFLGLFVDGELAGVNSGHKTGNCYRSRGLVVSPEFRGSGYGQVLLEETIRRSEGDFVWSMPKRTALPTYLKAGFVQTSDFFETETSAENCYVSSK